PAEPRHESGADGADGFQQVANMDAGNGAGRALELTIMVARERNDGTVATVFYPGRDQSHHALVPRLVIDADAAGQSRLVETIDKGERLVAHRRLDVAALVVDAVERFR